MFPFPRSQGIRHFRHLQIIKRWTVPTLRPQRIGRGRVQHGEVLRGAGKLEEPGVAAERAPLHPPLDRDHLIRKQIRRQFHPTICAVEFKDVVRGARGLGGQFGRQQGGPKDQDKNSSRGAHHGLRPELDHNPKNFKVKCASSAEPGSQVKRVAEGRSGTPEAPARAVTWPARPSRAAAASSSADRAMAVG